MYFAHEKKIMTKKFKKQENERKKNINREKSPKTVQ